MEDIKPVNQGFTLLAALVKTTYQVQITSPSDKDCQKPIAFGAGFMVNYRDHIFFITADHNIHWDDHELNVRTGVDNVASVFNNISDKERFSTLATPLGGFYHMEQLDISDPENTYELFDVAVCILTKEKHFKHPFLTEEHRLDGELLVKAGEQKVIFFEEHLVEANTEDNYSVFGKIKPKMNGLFLYRQNTLKQGLKYVEPSGDYLLFKAPELIETARDWAGLSGSPVLNNKGECVGVLCSVNVGTNMIFVKPIDKIKLLMDIAIHQEALEKGKKNIAE